MVVWRYSSRHTTQQVTKPFFITCSTNNHYTEQMRLRISENRVQKGVFGPKREEITG
jgi:hypothetical protein